MTDKNGITIHILDREFKLACPRGKEQELRNSAHFLDSKMREIRSKGSAVGVERIAIVAALNFAHELLAKPGVTEDSVTHHRIQALQEQIDSVLSDAQELETESLEDALLIAE